MFTEISDADLVIDSKNGNEAAYAELVRRNFRKVFATCMSMLSRLEDAEDATQETFLKGFTRLSSLQDDAKFSHWIIRVAKNNCFDLLRKRVRENTSPIEDYHKVTNSNEGRVDMLMALNKLPEQHRQPLMLFYFNGKDSRSVGQALNLTTKGAATRLSRARRALRELLVEEWQQ